MSSSLPLSSSAFSEHPESPQASSRPNPLTLNLLQDAIPKAIDSTAEEVRTTFQSFLETFQEIRSDGTSSPCYLDQVRTLRLNERTTLYIDYEHVLLHDEMLAQVIQTQYYRMEPYLKKAVQNMVRKYDPQYLKITSGRFAGEEGTVREFWVSWYNLPLNKRLRQVKTDSVGQLISITGTVTRTSEVRPELLFGNFQCKDCLQIIKDVEQEFKYTEPTTCLNVTCNNRTDFVLQVEKSKFADWQKVRIQENASEVPSGSMPRSMDVILRNEMVERAKAGDKILICGTPIVVPDVTQLYGNNAEVYREATGRAKGNSLVFIKLDGFGGDGVTGLKALGIRELNYKLVFLGCFVRSEQNKSSLNALHDMFAEDDPEHIAQQFSSEDLRALEEMREDRHLYHKLVSSIAPHIFGHEDVKKGVLLHLLGGVHKSTPEGMNLRGDINVCVVGDPSTAKSQFLKYVANLMPRAIYTSGKASSAAGLTASVVKDEETGEFTIEAGALMLADNGICCIDEFDKMDVQDQVAIHEAMEQQTISITKAGIQATLNARTAILAAANPIRGRYDKKMSLRQNITMSAPIMSRFDLFFIILDECNETTDWNIARHIVQFHRHQDEGVQPEFDQGKLLRFLQYARALKPRIGAEARELLVEKYRQLRQEDSAMRNSSRVTVRQLESMVRLSEALAKLNFADEVKVSHVLEAYNLLKTSIVTIERDRVEMEADEEMEDMIRATDLANLDAEMSQVADTEQSIQKHKLYLEADEYHSLTQQLVLRISQYEALHDDKGMRRSELIDWYLESREEFMKTEEDLIRERKLIKSVLNRLVKKDNILLELKEVSELAEDDETVQKEEDPLLTVQPNYAIV